MRKTIFFLALMMLTVLGAQAGEKKVYTSYNSSSKTLTYYYDDQYGSRSNVEYYPINNNRWVNYHDQVKTVTINASMQNAPLPSMKSLFSGGTGTLSNMTSIIGLTNLNTTNVTDMSRMFDGCSSLTSLNLSSFTTANVTDMSAMFDGCSSLTSLNLSSFNTANVTDMSSMFSECSSLTSLNLSSFITTNVTNMTYMFDHCESLISLNLSSFNTKNVTDMSGMFNYCKSLLSLNLNSFITTNVTNMYCMFQSCSALQSLDISSFNTTKVTNMSAMFIACRNLKEIDVDNFDVSHAEISDMFSTCLSLETIYCSHNWSYNAGTDMFLHCSKLVGGNGTTWSEDKRMDAYFARPDGLDGKPGYFTSTICPEPTNVKASNVSFTSAKISWNADESARKFYVRYYPASTDTYFNEVEATSTSCTLTNLEPGEKYYVYVVAQCQKDVTSNDNPQKIHFTTRSCTAPTNLKYSNVTENSATISWTPGASDQTQWYISYKIKNLSAFTITEVSTTSFTLQSLRPETQYEVKVKAICSDDLESEYAESIFFTTLRESLPCDAPTGVKVSNVTESSATFTFTPGSSDQTLWYVKCRPVGSVANIFAQLVNNTSVTFTELEPGTGYEVQVYADCGDNNSVPTEWYSFTTLAQEDGKKVYTSYNESTKTLTYYYNDKYEEYQNAGYTVLMYDGTGGCATDDYCEHIQTINIDPSMRNFALEKMKKMFSSSGSGSMSALTAINGIENLNTSKVTDMRGMFMYCGALEKINLSSLNTSNVVNMTSMFCGCEKLATITGIETLNTSKVEAMGSMFSGCNELIKLDLHKWDVSNVTNMSYMFSTCTKLKELNLTGFDVSKVKNMTFMFSFSQNLTTIYCDGNWKEKATGLTDSQYMFGACDALKGGNNTIYTSSNPKDITYARPDEPSQPGYFTKVATGIEEVMEAQPANSAAQKVMIDGQIYILRDGKAYTLQGAEVK